MAVKIRLMRVGKTKQPSYRVVVSDARSPRDGRYLEIVGHYQPRQEPSMFSVDDEKVLTWLRKGAQPTEQVHRLLVGSGVWERYESERASVSGAARTAQAKAKGAAAARAAREEAAKAEAEAAAKAEAEAKASAAAEAAAAEPAEEAGAEPEPAEASAEAAPAPEEEAAE